MKPIRTITSLLTLLSSLILLTACGGGDGDSASYQPIYNGITTAAVIDSNNTADLTTTVIETTRMGSDSENAPIGIVSSTASGSISTARLVAQTINKQLISNGLINDANSLPVGVTQTIDCYIGSISIDQNSSGTSGSVTYNNCTEVILYGADPSLDITATFNGTVYVQTYNDGSFTLSFTNFSVSIGSIADGYDTESLNLSATCDSTGFNCDIDFTGSDGRVYRISSNFTITGDDINGYWISGTVYDPDHGSITITTTTAISFAGTCSGGQPSSGQVTITGNSSSAVIIFNDCIDYDVSVDGGAFVTYTW